MLSVVYKRLAVLKKLCRVHNERDRATLDATKIMTDGSNLSSICQKLDSYPTVFDSTFVEKVKKMFGWHILSKGQRNHDNLEAFLTQTAKARKKMVLKTTIKVCTDVAWDKAKSSSIPFERTIAQLAQN